MSDWPMKMEEKVWGRVLHTFVSEHAAVSYLEVKEGFRCSRHCHKERANLFAVVDGRIVVEEWVDVGVRRHDLIGGMIHVVPSGVLHRFRVIESGHVVEVYWPDRPGGKVRMDDIKRLDIGGRDV